MANPSRISSKFQTTVQILSLISALALIKSSGQVQASFLQQFNPILHHQHQFATTEKVNDESQAITLEDDPVDSVEGDNLASIVTDEAKKLASTGRTTSGTGAGAGASDLPAGWSDKRLFAVELLKLLHEQYAGQGSREGEESPEATTPGGLKDDSTDANTGRIRNKDSERRQSQQRQSAMTQLLNAISADGDMRRLVDWLQNSFNLASIGELTTQFVVSKLGSVNCAAILKPDSEDSLIPRFLLFNEHFVDVPFELPIKLSGTECAMHARFDPLRKTVVLIHGFLAGYTLVDGLTNIKNRLLDLNKFIVERMTSQLDEETERRQSNSNSTSNNNYVLTEDLEVKIRQQQYNVIIVDWFNGANPVPRARYMRAATNAQVVGQLIARFLTDLIVHCRTPASNIQLIGHSLGCHVAGFTGKALKASGHKLGKITHLDPVGLCFGRLFSQPRYRLSPSDAHETQAVHVSLNIFDNPLDGAQSNFLVNGGRDQIGCASQSELKNSTSSSVSLLFDPEAGFTPCSHLRALALFEDDHSSQAGQCQMVGYKCATYERFLAGKCGQCDSQNSQCRLMSFPPIVAKFRRLTWQSPFQSTRDSSRNNNNHLVESEAAKKLISLVDNYSNGSIAWLIDNKELNQKISDVVAQMRPNLMAAATGQHGAPYVHHKPETPLVNFDDDIQTNSSSFSTNSASEELPKPPKAFTGPLEPVSYRVVKSSENYANSQQQNNEIKRSDRKLTSDQRERLAQTIDKIRSDTRQAIADSWTNLKSGVTASGVAEGAKYKVSSLIKSPFHLVPTHTVSLPDMDKLPNLAATLQAGVQAGVQAGSVLAATSAHISSGATAATAASAQLTEAPRSITRPETEQPAPLGGQALPPGSVNGPLFFLGTGPVSPYCVNYYQFRLLIAESRINRLLASNGLGPSRPVQIRTQQISKPGKNGPLNEELELSNNKRQQTLKGKLHLTVKLTDSDGHFFKGFTLVEDARALLRVPIESKSQRAIVASENMVELTMLLNTTRLEPVRISESIISYYFHKIVLADMIEVNYMSNIEPE